MSESLFIPKGANREEIYEAIIPQIKSVVSSETNTIANLANIAAILKEAFNFFWVGFYLVDSADELVLGPFQGPLACTRIKKGRGVCGTVFRDAKTIVVSDVEKFEGHIACSSLSRSEIVVPIFDKNRFIYGVLDVDSEHLDSFSECDKLYLEKISFIISTKLQDNIW